MADDARRTVGVEEELLLATPDGFLASASEILIADPTAQGRLSHELKREQIETATRPCHSMAELREQAAAEREHLAAVAARHGVRACLSGTSPHPGTATPFPGERFSRINAEFAAMATGQLTCGMHVHVAVDSPAEGIGVVDRIRGWLAVLTALAANSPFWQGVDSGYASYRMVVLSQLPPSGPAPVWGDLAAYQRCVEQVMATGAAFDPAMIYFDCRLSARYPTVEIRVTDVCAELDEVVLVAALCRALVDVAGREWADGAPPPTCPCPCCGRPPGGPAGTAWASSCSTRRPELWRRPGTSSSIWSRRCARPWRAMVTSTSYGAASTSYVAVAPEPTGSAPPGAAVGPSPRSWRPAPPARRPRTPRNPLSVLASEDRPGFAPFGVGPPGYQDARRCS